jgi:predicted TIM-barrel fold metal-dependent hydrolase
VHLEAALGAPLWRNPRVHAKVSGLNTAADPEASTAEDLRPYVDHTERFYRIGANSPRG